MQLDQTKVNQFRSAMVKKGYSLKKIDEYLTLKTKQYGKASGTDTAGERERNRAILSLRQDLRKWEKGGKFEDLVRRYAGVLEPYEIRQEYDAFHTGTEGEPWGPAKEMETEVQKWQLKPESGYSGL